MAVDSFAGKLAVVTGGGSGIGRELAVHLAAQGCSVAACDRDEVRRVVADLINTFRDKAPVSAAEAAGIILDGVRSGQWRILIGRDAHWLDEQVRARPEAAYDYAELLSRGPGADAAAAPAPGAEPA